MQGGRRRNDGFGNEFTDPNCAVETVDCFPKAIVQFERIKSENQTERYQELNFIGDVLDSAMHTKTTVIEKEARGCLLDEVLNRKELYNPNRIIHNSINNNNNEEEEGEDVMEEERKFTYQQLNIMKSTIENLYQKYSLPPLSDAPLSQRLLGILREYYAD